MVKMMNIYDDGHDKNIINDLLVWTNNKKSLDDLRLIRNTVINKILYQVAIHTNSDC